MTTATKVAPAKTKIHPAKKATKTTKKTTMTNERSNKSQAPVKTENTTTKVNTDSPWYVFCSQGCGFCKKAEPHVDALIEEGYNLLKLDVAEPANQTLVQEMKTKWNTQCGTPWFINSETGKGVCGYREKDVLKMWLDGEDIPEPPRPKSPPPRPPFNNASDPEVDAWKETYTKWLEENDHLPDNQKKSADEILKMPRPNSQPPSPPSPTASDEELNTWAVGYDAWTRENSHLPNLQPGAAIVQRFKLQRDARQAGGTQPLTPGQPLTQGNVPTAVAPSQSKDLNVEFYYMIEGDRDVPVYADEAYIRALEHQYYIREDGGMLSKVVGDANYKSV